MNKKFFMYLSRIFAGNKPTKNFVTHLEGYIPKVLRLVSFHT